MKADKEFWVKQIGEDWTNELSTFLKSNGQSLIDELNNAYENSLVYPRRKNVFRAFRETSYLEARVLILGQDPYYNGTATGIAFGNEFRDIRLPSPSIMAIVNSLEKVYNVKIDHSKFDWSLKSWCSQGVLMLNSALTVETFTANSHSNMWKSFIEAVVKSLQSKPRFAFMFLGSKAKAFSKYTDMSNHMVTTFEHPAAALRNKRDWECPHFVTINEYLKFCKTTPIQWINQ